MSLTAERKRIRWSTKLVFALFLLFTVIAIGSVGALYVLKMNTNRQYNEVQNLPLLQTGKSRYPFVFVHGILPFTGVHDLALNLRKNGYSSYTTQYSAINSIHLRAQELAKELDAILALTKSQKVNIIAHSMGGLDARYMISSLNYADKVASLTTLGTPHHGSEIADYMVHENKRWVAKIVNWFAIYFIVGSHRENVDASMGGRNLTTAFMESEFNPKNPDSPLVYYQSWAGTCPNDNFNFISLLQPVCKFMHSVSGENDGLVSQKSMQWGHYRGVIPVDHFQEVNSPATLAFLNNFDIDKFFVQVADELASMGF